MLHTFVVCGENQKSYCVSCVVSVGRHTDGGGAERGGERGAEETLAGGTGPTERGDDWTQETREAATEPGAVETPLKPDWLRQRYSRDEAETSQAWIENSTYGKNRKQNDKWIKFIIGLCDALLHVALLVWTWCLCRQRTTSSGPHTLTRCRGDLLSRLGLHQLHLLFYLMALSGGSGGPRPVCPWSGTRVAVKQRVLGQPVWI